MKSAIKYLCVFGIAFILSGAIAYYAIRLFTQSADEIILPELRGKNIIYVLETLTNMGLNAKLYGSQYDDIHPRYAVITQDPLPGTTIKKGRDVVIYLSKGKKENIIPDLRQIPLNQAVILLEKNEFSQGHIAKTFSSKTPKNSIISQYPEPFTTALKGTVCTLLVSKGEPVKGFVMPQLSGITLEKAALALAKEPLKISKIISDTDEHQPYGVVLSHIPKPGNHATRYTPVTLVINDAQKNQQMNPDKLGSMVLLRYSLPHGFLNRHVRVETNMFGPILNLYNEFMKPGEQIIIWAPTDTKTLINIFIDQTLIKVITIDPWKKDSITGDLLWESLPLQSYPLISPDWEMN